MAGEWQPIRLSAKVFGHLSQGLYRTPAGAIKELISNSFDADANLVSIHTDFPRFESFSCEDNGTGMSRDEFQRLMNRGIGSSYKRVSSPATSAHYKRPLVGRLGLGILSLAQICTQFDVVSHHIKSKTAFRATIKFPPYTRAEMDKVSASDMNAEVQGGEFRIAPEKYDETSAGLRVYTRHLREPFRKTMRTLPRLAKQRAFKKSGPYESFDEFLDSIYFQPEPQMTQSLNLSADYDQLIFGLALAPPLPLVEERNMVTSVPTMSKRQSTLKGYNFKVRVDNLDLLNPVCLPFDRDGHTAYQCELHGSESRSFEIVDGPYTERCQVIQHTARVGKSDVKFHVYELDYSARVAGTPLAFSGYLFQQTGRLYPRDIQGVLVRLSNVAIGKHDNSMLTYPYAEGPRYSMISSELFVREGFDDALNIDRDSFNELHPHFMRTQSYVHSLLNELIFPETWSEEKERNKKRRDKIERAVEKKFYADYQKATGDVIKSITRVEKADKKVARKEPAEAAVQFRSQAGQLEIDRTHPLLQPIFRKRRHAPLLEKLIVAFERANQEGSPARRRQLFYKLLNEIFSGL